MALLIASDIHVAEIWDHIGDVLPRSVNYLNPNTMFRDLVRRVKPRDALILNGDLIDYHDAHYHPDGATNWDLFFSILKRAKGTHYLNLGNHDYHRRPYNLSIHGLAHVNVSENVRKRYQERIGHCHFRWFGELGSINVNHRRPKTLASYPGKRSYHAVWEGTELLVLETGPDAYNKTINLFKPIHWRVLFDEMACKGLDEEQLALLRRRLDAGRGSILIFTHAPPLFSMEDFPPIDLSHDGRLKSRVSDRVFIDGNKEFLEALLQSARNITVISSHTHIPRQFLLDKHTGTLRHCDMDEFNRVRDDPRYLKFLITLPLGGVRTQNRAVGYLRLDGRGFQYVVLRDFSRRRRG